MNYKDEKHEFEKGSSILFILTLIANIINYLFQIVMGRMFNVQEYGELNSLFAIFTFTSLPMTALTLVVSKYVTEYNSEQKTGKVLGFLRKISGFITGVSLVMVLIGSLCSKWIASFIKIDNNGLIIALFIVAGFSTLTSMVTGTLQGIKEFMDYGIVNIINPLIKLLGSVVLVLLGFRIYGVFGAMLAGNIVVLVFGFYIIKRKFNSTHSDNIKISIRKVLQFSMGSLIINCGLSFFTNIDVILIKHYFSPDEAGLYSSAAVLSKMILYVSTAVIVALFPLVIENNVSKKNTSGILKKAFLYGGGLSVFAALMLVLLAKPMILILYGSNYIGAVKYIFPLSLMIVVLSLVSILANYALALDKIKLLSVCLMAGIALSLVGIAVLNSTIMEIVFVLTVILALIFIANLIYLLKKR